jgi:hypothetical protein
MKLIHPLKTFVTILLLVLSAAAGRTAPLGTGFTYQGLLNVNGNPANGSYEMRFTLYQQGNPMPGPSLTLANVPVMLGVFTVSLDFGAGVFDGTAYELEIAVREQGGGGMFVLLQPRQALAAAPNATHARTVSTVPDSALSPNVPLLNGSPMFTTPLSATMLRVADSGGAGLLRFGPTDDCTIGVDPAGPMGLLLRDPKGIRILSPDPMSPPVLRFGPTDDCSIGIDPVLSGLRLRDPGGIRIAPGNPMIPATLRFGPTDDCSIGIDPAFPGMVERDPIGFRLLGLNNQGCRLIFGPTMDCTVEVDPAGPQGLLLRDPRGIRILSPDVMRPPILRWGPTDDCSIGIDPAFPGLVERDPVGFRLLGLNNQGCRLLFGPTDLCTVEVRPPGTPGAVPGLLLRDPSGIRILSPDLMRPPILRWGPTDDCSIGIDPAFPGLVERDPVGFRLLGLNNQGCRLIFGPTMDCTVEVDPVGPQGLLLRDPRGIRILSPAANSPPVLRWGPTDDCSIGIDPAFPGLVERDPIGFRLLGQNNQGCRLIFGPTMDCTVEVRPPGTAGAIPGLLLRDPSGIRILSPDVMRPPVLRFGPTDDCSIGIDPVLSGLRLRDPGGIRIAPLDPMIPATLRFGPTDDCSIGIDPAFPGLVERDPIGFRLLGRNNEGCRLIFGPTMDCTVEVDPAGPQGLLLRDPRGIRILSPDPMSPPALRFGPTDDCSIGIDPVLSGLRLRDPSGIRIAPTDPMALPILRFGPTDDCSIGIDPAFPGLVERDPIGFRLLGQNNEGCRLLFGPTDLCTIEVQPPGTPGAIPGLLLRDPSGIRLLNPAPTGGPSTLLFGPTDQCRIAAPAGPNGGMFFSDPNGFTFDGVVKAQMFMQISSRRFKDDVKPIEEPLEKISKLQGVRFTWNEAKGGRKDIGFIAEDVAKVIPEVVAMEDDGKNARGVNYDHLVAVAIEGIKAQQTQIQTLEREKAELKSSLETLQTRLDRLSRQMEALANR